jgi:phage regulator Rha-like protein
MNALTTATKTMSSRDIAELTNKEHKNVLRVIRELMDGQILDAQNEPLKFEYRGQQFDYYELNKRDSMVVVARLSPEFMAAVVDRWQELEAKTVQPVIALPQNYIEALEHLLISKKYEQLAIAERDHAIATKSQISDKKTAQAMNTASQAVKKLKKVEAELGRCVENATIIAVKNLTGTEYAWQPLRKWCKAKGVKAVEVVDARFGIAKAWPSAAWEEVHGVILEKLFV